LAAVDPRPIDPAAVTQELESLRPHFPTGLAESLRKRKPVAAIPIQRD
jgi:hypothetical protein